jgi:hypothetical protein
MHDESSRQRLKDDAALAAAVRALPDAVPPRDGWPALAGRIARRRRTRDTLRVALPAALAAGVAIAIALPSLWPARAPSSAARPAQQAAAVAARASAMPLAELRAQSQRLQAWVRALEHNGAPLSGDSLADAVALQDRIGLLDLQLSAATDPATRASLWRQRNVLLQQLGLLHLQPYAVAEHAQAMPNATTML